jgi:hypothetical protein
VNLSGEFSPLCATSMRPHHCSFRAVFRSRSLSTSSEVRLVLTCEATKASTFLSFPLHCCLKALKTSLGSFILPQYCNVRNFFLLQRSPSRQQGLLSRQRGHTLGDGLLRSKPTSLVNCGLLQPPGLLCRLRHDLTSVLARLLRTQ